MFLNEYELNHRRNELLAQARQRRLAREAADSVSLIQRAGYVLLTWGARFAATTSTTSTECYRIETRGQAVTVCRA